jgi:hypothetical protein
MFSDEISILPSIARSPLMLRLNTIPLAYVEATICTLRAAREHRQAASELLAEERVGREARIFPRFGSR